MAENVTPDPASGAPEGGTPPTPPAASGEGAPVVSTADAFAAERAQLQAQARDWQAKYDRLQASQAVPAATTPAPAPATDQFLTRDAFREELRRQRELDSAVGALKEQFPNAVRTLSNVDSFDSVEALQVAAENEQKAFSDQVGPAVQAAIDAALKPYVDKFGPLQTAPAGAQPGVGDGLPTLADVERMSLSEQDALEKQHPGLIDRLHREAFSRLI